MRFWRKGLARERGPALAKVPELHGGARRVRVHDLWKASRPNLGFPSRARADTTGGHASMSTATLEIVDLGGITKRYVIDCPHGTTTVFGMDGSGLGDAVLVTTAVMKHFSEEGCDCTRELRRQYPPTLLPRTLWNRYHVECL